MLRAAAATELLDDKVRGLSGSAASSRTATRGMNDDIDRTGTSARKASGDINQFSGRLGLVAQAVGALGPGLIPIAAVGIPAVTGLASSLGFAALAGGTAIGAFQGVGDALEAMNKAHLEPTAANLAKAREAMQQISPAARDMVRELQSMGTELKGLRDTAAEGMFPGLIEGMDALETRLPDVQRIIAAVAGELGDIASDSGASLAGARWDDFFTFLATDAPSALRDMATGTGNVTHALAEMWMAMDPVNDKFSSWLVKVSADFDRWASGLSGSTGLQEFFDYLDQIGPQVADTVGAIANALLQIVQAAAPIGGPVLAAIEALANALASIADSDLGTPIFGMIAALSALRLAMRGTTAMAGMMGVSLGRAGAAAGGGGMLAGVTGSAGKAKSSLASLRSDLALLGPAYASAGTKAERLKGAFSGTAGTAAKAGGAIAGLAILTSGAGDKFGVTNTASLALMGTMAGPWGAALGAAAGAVLDLTHANDGAEKSLTQLNAAINSGNMNALAASLRQVNAELKDAQNLGGIGDIFETIGKDIGATFSGNFDRIGNLKKAAEDARGALEGAAAFETGAGLLNSFGLIGQTASQNKREIDSMNRSLAQASAALGQMGNYDAFRSSTLDARDALKQYGAVLKDNGDIMASSKRGGLALRASLQGVAQGAQQTANGMKNAERQSAFLTRARGDFVRLATAMGMSGPAARRMATNLGLVGQGARSSTARVADLNSKIKALKAKRVQVMENGAAPSSKRVRDLDARIKALKAKRVAVQEQGASPSRARVQNLDAQIKRLRGKIVQAQESGAAGSAQRVANLRAQIASLRDKSVTLTTTEIHRVINMAPSGGNTARGGADGMTVPGARRPYGDSVYAHLAPGEEVISNRYGQADRNRELLKAINANRYAGGGTVRPNVSVAAPNVSVGGAGVQVFIDGREVRAVVREEIADHQETRDSRARANR